MAWPAVLAASLALQEPPRVDDPRASAAWWTSNYGQLTESASPQVAVAQGILTTLWRAAGQRLGFPPRLVILAKDRPGLLALALPDNSIVMSHEGLQLCLRPRRGAEPAPAAQARLGLVLAHELDHILSDDDWHVAAFNAEATQPVELRTVIGSRDARYATELRADANAVLLVVAAGLDPRQALQPTSFLEEWARERQGLSGENSGTHPDTQTRVDLMRREFERLVAELPLFKRGVEELGAGRGEAALRAFDDFHRRTRYFGKELRNNLGLAHYAIGLGALSRCDGEAAVRFRLATWIDASLLPRMTLRGPGADRCAGTPQVATPLERAAKNLEEALAADPGWLTARLNLIAVLVLINEDQARAQARALGRGALGEKLRALPRSDPARIAAESAIVICDYLARRSLGDPVADSIRELRELHERHPDDPAVVFNLARVLQEAGRADEARASWALYLGLDAREPYASAARRALLSLGDDPR